MGKKKKTLRQKKQAELRRLKEFQEIHSSVSIPTEEAAVASSPSAQSTFSYTFSLGKKVKMVTAYSLRHDLRKTLIVSSVIFISLITLSVLLQTNVLVVPLVSRY